MTSKRQERLNKARAKKKAAKAAGMSNPGGATSYALKQAGKKAREYRVEGGMLLSLQELRDLEMPGPYIVTMVEEVA